MDDKKSSRIVSDKETSSLTEAQQTVLQKINAAATAPTEYQTKFDAHRVSMKIGYPPPEYVFATNGVPHMTTSELHLVTAGAKHGKTSFTNIICSAAISENQQWGNIKCLLPHDNRLVVVFDCEENISDTAMHNKQILRMAGLDDNEDNPNLMVFNLRQDMSYDDRRFFIFDTIRRHKPRLVIIDGLRDLILDINDPKENPKLLSELMSLASETCSALVCVLHNNPNSDKARGWSGTEGTNRCGYTYNLVKKGNLVTVSVPLYRHAPVPEFRFTFDNDGTPTSDEFLIQDEQRKINEQKQKDANAAKEAKNAAHLKIVLDVLHEHNGEFSRAELVKFIDAKQIDGFKRSVIQGFITEHLSVDTPRFVESVGTGKMTLVNEYVDGELFDGN